MSATSSPISCHGCDQMELDGKRRKFGIESRVKCYPYSIVMSPRQYGGYDPRLVTEWVRVRIPSKAWLHLLREKKSDFHL
ncbi:hypothetical protein TNCV_817661 [Trichonephila clavipes]|nr:hypothetical protein TNCV_817661 [Trichonephila clavipes]